MVENRVISTIIGLAIALILIGILLPIGLSDLVTYDGSYNSSLSGTEVTGTNSTIATLVATILPVMIVIGLILAFVATMSRKGGVQ
jgi:hypothetical protein